MYWCNILLILLVVMTVTSTHFQNSVCQNCAKILRYRLAYTHCLNDDDNAYSWCKRLYDFTNPLG